MAKILVVDDNAINREFLVTLLQYGGHDLTVAADGAEAFAAVENTRPDLVISDILMPVADGYEFVRRVRANPDVASTPVIFYTAAYHRREALPLTTAATGVQFLNKPSEPEVILLMVDSALGGSLRPEAKPALDGAYNREHLRVLTDKLAQKVLELEREIVERKLAEVARDEIAADRAAKVEVERAARINVEREARLEAERQGRVKDEFLATLSHELRTPLNAILGWSQILENTREESELKVGLEVIARNARMQTQIIEDLLDMSRIVAGKVRLEMEQIELRSTLRLAVETVQHAADVRGVRLHLTTERPCDPITGDPGRLQQVFCNLLTNAVKFTPRGGHVRVDLRPCETRVEVRVTDTGEGIAPDFLPLVFDRFRQADGSTTRRHGGLGLGLSIVKQLVELHGGTATVSSGGVGQGTTFTVALPVTRTDTASGSDRLLAFDRPPETTVRCDHLAGLTVLVVDDENDARGLLKHILEACGACVFTGESAAEGLSLLLSVRPHVLISDVGMPGEDGYALLAMIRAHDSDVAATPVIALTAYAHAEDRARAIAAGFDTHLAKPVETNHLVATVARLSSRAVLPR